MGLATKIFIIADQGYFLQPAFHESTVFPPLSGFERGSTAFKSAPELSFEI
jgi:hypothetical protein